MQDNPKYPGAPAILLDREYIGDDAKNLRTERFRIKIVKDEGKKYADIIIPYFPGRSDVQDLHARVIGSDGRSKEFSGPVFDRMIVKSKHLKYQAKAVTLPDVATGTIIEYSYTVHWRGNWPEWLKHPWFREAATVPTLEWILQHELYTVHAHFCIRPLPKTDIFWASVRLPEGAAIQRQVDRSWQLELHDVAPLENEDFMPPENMVNSRVQWYYGVNIQEGTPPELFWHDYGKLEALVIEPFIGHYKSIQRLTAELISSTNSPEEKLQKLYARAQQLRFISYEHILTQQEEKRQDLKENHNVEDVLHHGYAYANEANYFFVAMVRAAGFQASIVRLASRSRAVFLPVILDATQLNATVVMVHVGQKELFLDPATRFCPYGFLPWSEAGVTGIQINKQGGTFITIPGQGAEYAVTARTGKLKLASDGKLEGTLDVVFAGQQALTRRLDLYDEDEAGQYKAIGDEIRSLLPTGATVDVQNISDFEKSDNELRITCKISVPRFAVTTGRRMLFPGALLQSTRIHPLEHPKRNYPVYFRYAYSEVDKLSIELPERFHVESVPGPKDYSNNFSRFSSTFAVQDSTVEFRRSFSIDGFFFPVSSYALLRTTFDTVISSDTEKMVLQQVATARR